MFRVRESLMEAPSRRAEIIKNSVHLINRFALLSSSLPWHSEPVAETFIFHRADEHRFFESYEFYNLLVPRESIVYIF